MLKTSSFKEYLQGKPFTRLVTEEYFALHGFQAYESYDVFWRFIRQDIKQGSILVLDEGLWLFAAQETKEVPSNEGTSFQTQLSQFISTVFRRYPKI
jgi:hypothetical protein